MNDRITVAHVVRKWVTAEWGGTESHVSAITSALLRHQVQSEVHAPTSGDDRNSGIDPRVHFRRFHAFLPCIGPATKRSGLRASGGNIVSLDEYFYLVQNRNIDLVHLHTLGRLGGAVRTAMKHTGRPFIISVHGGLFAEPERIERETRKRLDGVLDLGQPFGLLFGARQVLDQAARVITFNDAEHKALQQRIGHRAVRMNQGVFLDRFDHGSAERAEQRWPILSGKTVIGVLGRLSTQKNQLLALQAFAKANLPNAVLALAGAETDPGYQQLLHAEALQLGCRDRVIFLGNLHPDAEVPDFVTRADLLLTPSTHEAFGLVVIEAWAAKKPVIFHNHSGLASLATHVTADDVTIPSLDVALWTAKIQQLLNNPERCRMIAENNRARVREHFSWESVAQQTQQIYREAIAETQPSHQRTRHVVNQ